MNLWIRSQKKDKLFKINGVDITKMNDNSYEITGYTSYNIYLGTYKTKERAIEILDEIQDELISSDFMPIEKNEEAVLTCGSARIYQMPED